eukprot:11176020-Lingulodinium_polyedra.AAC.1
MGERNASSAHCAGLPQDPHFATCKPNAILQTTQYKLVKYKVARPRAGPAAPRGRWLSWSDCHISTAMDWQT